MRSSDSRPVADDLALHAGFLRAVARGLLADEHLAEDVVQQAYLQALARPPESRGFLRAWLARVVRNLALNSARAEQRRTGRERAAARPELDSAGERAALELALQREVAAALAELDEPYRTVVHLRHFRGLAPAAIAAKLGVPLKTVETRLTRAHARLRTRLARAWDAQDERARAVWLALAPAGKGIGGLLMAKTIAWVGVGGALVAGLVWTWRALDGAGARTEAPQVAEQPLEPPPALSASPVPEPERELAVEESEPTLAEPDPVPVVDPDAELRASLDELGFLLDRSLDGRLDPGAILDAAFLVLARELGSPELEPDFAGRVVIPFEGLPEGVTARLCIGKPVFFDLQEKRGLALEIELDRSVPLLHGGWERAGSMVMLSTLTNEAEDLLRLEIGTSVMPLRLEAGSTTPPDQWTDGLTLHTPLDEPSRWILKAIGMQKEGGVDEEGDYRYRGGSWEIPQALDGRPWPPVDDLRRFNLRLHELHAGAKERAGR